jgi:hypothetical protein
MTIRFQGAKPLHRKLGIPDVGVICTLDLKTKDYSTTGEVIYSDIP